MRAWEFYGRGLAYLAVITVAAGAWCWVWGRYASVAAWVMFTIVLLDTVYKCARRKLRK